MRKLKKRQRESLLEKGVVRQLGWSVTFMVSFTESLDPLKFLTMIFLGNLVKWFNENGSKIACFR